MIMTIMPGFLTTLIMIIYIGVLIYMISLTVRFVRAVEKIASKIENSDKI